MNLPNREKHPPVGVYFFVQVKLHQSPQNRFLDSELGFLMVWVPATFLMVTVSSKRGNFSTIPIPNTTASAAFPLSPIMLSDDEDDVVPSLTDNKDSSSSDIYMLI